MNSTSVKNAGGSSLGGATSVNRVWSKADTIRTSIAGLIVLGLLFWAYLLSSNTETGGRASFSLLIGLALGIVFERGRFCFFCIFRDSIQARKNNGFLSVITALAVGAIGYAIVFGMYLPDTSGEYLPTGAHIGPTSWVLAVAALAFGFGMALSGACISGHLYRIGQGSLRAVPALIGALLGFGLGFITWNTLYLRAIQEAPTLWLPHYIGYAGSLAVTLFALGVIAYFLLKSNTESAPEKVSGLALLRSKFSPATTGVLVGVIGTIAYMRIEPLGVTRQLSAISRKAFDKQSLLPETLNGLDTLAGCVGIVSETISNNGWLIIGFVLASFAGALSANRFKFEIPTVRNSSTALVGGILMGWGSMTALGCTVGVLLSSTQAFAVSGWVFFLFAFLGVYLGIKAKVHTL
ncbi:MAG: YeeE/YedE family protein [Actinobacteria bacterium]|nr:YeeE/YedE family protein [Actinomycetota bacterium]